MPTNEQTIRANQTEIIIPLLRKILGVLSILTSKVNVMATVLVDLQGAETRIAADLKRAADMITALSQGHTVSDADVEMVVTQLNAAADAFDAANPMSPSGP